MSDALTLANTLLQPHSLAWTLACAAHLHQLRREAEIAQERAKAALLVSTEHGFQFWEAAGTGFQGWALTMQGQREKGIAEVHQGIVAWRTTGAEMQLTHWLALLSEAYWKQRQIEQGLAVLADALALVNKNEERAYEPEMHRLKGELLLQQSPDNYTEAEACFYQAISIAQNQSAKSWELRAATSLARLWRSQGKRDEARALLEPVYSWFTEGFDKQI